MNWCPDVLPAPQAEHYLSEPLYWPSLTLFSLTNLIILVGMVGLSELIQDRAISVPLLLSLFFLILLYFLFNLFHAPSSHSFAFPSPTAISVSPSCWDFFMWLTWNSKEHCHLRVLGLPVRQLSIPSVAGLSLRDPCNLALEDRT